MKRAFATLATIMVIISVLGTASCSRDVHNLKITEKNKDNFMETIKDSKSLTVGEVRMLIAFQMRNAASQAFGVKKETMVGKTVGQIIDEERQFESHAKKEQEKEDQLAAQAKAEEEARAGKLRKAIRLTVYGKSFAPSNFGSGQYEDRIVIKCAYQNTSGKDIRAFKGSIRFTDLFGSRIDESGITISDPIKAGQKGYWTGYLHYNQFMEREVRLRNTDLKDMKVVWLPSSIIFADGSVLGEQPSQ